MSSSRLRGSDPRPTGATFKTHDKDDTILISRRRAPLAFALVLLALASLSAPAGAQPQADDAACAVPAAIPNDGLDDRAAIQSALTSQGCAHLPVGRYDVDSIQVAPPARRPFMMLDASGAELYGEGPGTMLAFRGAVGAQDWEGIRMTGVDSSLHDLSIVTDAISETNEQTHAVRLIGPASDAEISRVSFHHPIRAAEKSGDCVQLVGVNDGREIARVRIHDNDFAECDRSGVAVHGGTTQLEIVDNRFSAIGNTDLDFEGTGDTGDVTIARNTFMLSPGPHGIGALQLQLVDRAHVTGNVFDGRGIEVNQSDDAEIDHNTITLTQATTAPVLFVSNDSARTRIHDNAITRDASAGAGAVINAGPRGTGTPAQLEIDANTLVQQTSFHVISSSGLVGLRVRRNAIDYSGALANEMSGVRALGSAGTEGIRTTDVRIEANRFDGALRSAIATSGALTGVGTLDTADNVATGAEFGIFCDNFASQGKVTGPFTSTRDRWPAPNCGPAGFVAVILPSPEDPPRPPGGAPGDGGARPPAADTTAPLLSRVSLSRPAGPQLRTVLRFSSSEAGTLSILIQRLRPGRKPTPITTLTRPIAPGPGSVALSGRPGAKRLQPGRYRLTLTASDAAGNRSKPTARTFTIPPG